MKRIIVCVLAFGMAGYCQTTPNTASAKQLLQQTIAAMSAGQNAGAIRDFSLTGVMRIAGSSDADPVKIVSRGADDMRMEITRQEGGAHAVALLHGRGRIKEAGRKETPVSNASRAGTEIAFLPMPAVLLDLLGSAREISDLGSDLVNGRPAHHIVISRQYPKEKDPLGIMTARSRTEFYIDAQSFLILKIRHFAYDARGRVSSQRELNFADYRPVNGFVLPFSLAETLDGQSTWTITATSIELNPKLTDTDFRL